MTDVNDWSDPVADAYLDAHADDPPDWYLEQEAERHHQIHRDQDHAGGECTCPVAEPEHATEAPF